MNEKRFRIDSDGYIYDNGEIVKSIMDLLNELNNENQELKSEIQKLKIDYSQFEELKQEYISRKELTYSEKLIIEDFYDWLINNHF